MHTGFAIALAWPDTLCKQAGSWYDGLLFWLGINKNYYYKVGHAAVVLVDASTGKCSYFDFGRYHSPAGSGRVRSSETDFELEIKVIANVSFYEKRILNIEEIIQEIFKNKSCHGEGELHISYTHVDYKLAKLYSIKMQLNSPIPYGPFILRGTNCSRFVKNVILNGNPSLSIKNKLNFQLSLTPTPIGNVNALTNKMIFKEQIVNLEDYAL